MQRRRCRLVTITGVTTHASGANTDDCDPECCDHVVITGCDFSSGDDNIAVKSGRDDDGRRVATPSRNIVVRGCRFRTTEGSITCGSEESGGVENVYVHDCIAACKYALYLKANTRRGGFVRNINLDAVSATGFASFAYATLSFDDQAGAFNPTFSGFTIQNCRGDDGSRIFEIHGLPGDPIDGITVRRSAFSNIQESDLLSDVSPITFTDATRNGSPL